MAGRTPSASFRPATPAATSQAVTPVEYSQFKLTDFQTDEGIAHVNTQLAALFTQFNQLLGAAGPSVLASGVDVRGASVTGLAAPAAATDAVSLGHASANFGAQAQQPQLDIGGRYALKGLTATYGNTVTLQNQVAGFQTSTASSGFQLLPSGLILQWGHSGTIATGAGTSVSFNEHFPTACLNVVVTDDHAGGGFQGMSVTTFSTTAFTAVANGSGNGVYWMAIGN